MLKMNRARQIAIALLGATFLLIVSGALTSAGGTAPAAPSNLEARVVQDALKITLLWELHADPLLCRSPLNDS